MIIITCCIRLTYNIKDEMTSIRWKSSTVFSVPHFLARPAIKASHSCSNASSIRPSRCTNQEERYQCEHSNWSREVGDHNRRKALSCNFCHARQNPSLGVDHDVCNQKSRWSKWQSLLGIGQNRVMVKQGLNNMGKNKPSHGESLVDGIFLRKACCRDLCRK